MKKIFDVRKQNGAISLAAIVQDGKACGPYRMERTYYGHSLGEAQKLFRAEMKSKGAIFDDEYGY